MVRYDGCAHTTITVSGIQVWTMWGLCVGIVFWVCEFLLILL
uniref:Uncharacterized protein n=1 Tax=Anguilla anguilla TaxID=7936 RepID=A0A0E9WUR0_ANGAN